jgi:hypothetical protein
MYHVHCVCGYSIESKATILACAQCRRLIVIEWPTRDNVVNRPEIVRGLKLCGQFESAPTGSIGEEQSTT